MNFDVEIVKHKKCKYPKIKIRDSKTVKIVIPDYSSKKTALQLAEENREWILKTLSSLQKKENSTKNIFEKNKNKILFFGQWLDLKVNPNQKKKYILVKNTLLVKKINHIDTFYRDIGKDFFLLNSEYFGKKISHQFGKITIRKQKTLWGSCNHKGDLSYNLKLIKAPKFVGEYVCAHEVCHLKEKNHSKRFYNLVDSIFERRVEAEKWLKENSKLLHYDYNDLN
ncbi:MAG: M48 family metallopeptidase [Campylobacterales bacterium]|nr:M48 family metallopeptidase [Campylobacterales bacterium]